MDDRDPVEAATVRFPDDVLIQEEDRGRDRDKVKQVLKGDVAEFFDLDGIIAKGTEFDLSPMQDMMEKIMRSWAVRG